MAPIAELTHWPHQLAAVGGSLSNLKDQRRTGEETERTEEPTDEDYADHLANTQGENKKEKVVKV